MMIWTKREIVDGPFRSYKDAVKSAREFRAINTSGSITIVKRRADLTKPLRYYVVRNT